MKNYFDLTRSQLIGLTSFAVLVVLVFALPAWINSRNVPNLIVDSTDLKYYSIENDSIDEFESTNYSNNNFQYKKKYFQFDPNKLNLNDWKELNFSEKQSQVIFNYCQQNGPLTYKEELKKIYVISEEKYFELEPFILLPNKIDIDLKFSLNNASQSELEALPNIGEKFAERIIKYRNLLGGFYNETQLLEVFGMTDEVYQTLLENTKVISSEVRKIKINSATKSEIDKHPYINFEMTALILKKRDQQKIENLDFLKESNSFSSEEIDKILPYIDFE